LVFGEDLEMEKNVENNPQINTEVVSICTYACAGYKLGSFDTHIIKNAFWKIGKKKETLTRWWYDKESRQFL
jgi:hypothetical protein